MYNYNQYVNHCLMLQDNLKYRCLPDVSVIGREDFIDFSSNDYLNLSCNTQLLQAAINAGNEFGVGSTGSRVLSGNNRLCVEFEERIAQDKITESAIIWNSGFLANFSSLSALLDKQVLGNVPLVFFDRLNHASLYQAVQVSGAELVRYQHNDMVHLKDLLSKYADDKRSKFIVIETLYGMDGDVAPLAEIVELAYKYDVFLYLDEAHATGILGRNGYGMSPDYDLSHIAYLSMGTFSKAIGTSGAYTASSIAISNYLINKAKGFIYSTAPSPLVMGASYVAWQMIAKLAEERQALLKLADELRQSIKALGFDTHNSSTHIIPILLGKEERVLHVQKLLLEQKIIISAIRPPTVPPNSSRLRIALSLQHREADINRLLEALRTI